MADDRIRILEERLTRIESALTQRPTGINTGGGGFTPPGGVIVDSAPWAGSQFQQRAEIQPVPWTYWRPRWPTPVVDPGPFPTPVVDPAPWPWPIVDPAVFAQQSAAAATLGRIGKIGDPPPPDFSRLTLQQLEATIHSISAERARLDAMEEMVKKQIESLKKQPG
jgi:hypothetical protein